MKILTIILNLLLLIIIILSVLDLDNEWQGEDIWYLPLFLSAPAASLYVIFKSK
jgi:hypothetical protein